MAYNNIPYGLPNYYYPTYQTQQNQPMQNNQGLIWVSGEAGAKAYLVAPNTTVQLWDSEENVVYIKSADSSGMPSMKILDYKIRGNTPESSIKERREDFATKEEAAEYFNSDEERSCEKCSWRLRNATTYSVQNVEYTGKISDAGLSADWYDGIRPAMWISI